jgi:hypothetical protein
MTMEMTMANGNSRWHESFRGILKDLLDRLPGWPSERFMIILMTWGLGCGMLWMAKENPELWAQELYKTILTVVVVTGFVNMILAFYFAANKSDEQKAANTADAFKAFRDQAGAARTIAETAATVAGTNGNGNGGGMHVDLPPDGKLTVEGTGEPDGGNNG